jgi:hypothetical protein
MLADAGADADAPNNAGAQSTALVADVSVTAPLSHAALVGMLQRDPGFMTDLAIRRYEEKVTDYTCVLRKQERIAGKLSEKQSISVKFRGEPLSVYMNWIENEDECRRALYVKGRWTNRKGEELAKVEPAGALIRLIVSETKIPIHGARSKKASRRTIDEFGFLHTLQLLNNINDAAAAEGKLDYKYVGEGMIDGRPTFKLLRYLPYDGRDARYPDAMLIMHIDQEWLVPTALYSYADREGRTLLGSYEFVSVRFNVGLSEADFRF